MVTIIIEIFAVMAALVLTALALLLRWFRLSTPQVYFSSIHLSDFHVAN